MSGPVVDLREFHETFFTEASEHLANLERTLLSIDEATSDRAPIDEAFRAAHSVKGSAGIFGFAEVTRFTHALETLLDGVRTGQRAWTREIGASLLRSVDTLRGLLSTPDASLDAEGQALRLHLLALAGGDATPPSSPDSAPARAPANVDALGRALFDVRFVPAAEIFARGTDPLLVLRDLGRAATVVERRVVADALPSLDALDPTACHVGWELVVACEGGRADLEEVFEFVVGFGEVAIRPHQATEDGLAAAPEASLAIASHRAKASAPPKRSDGSALPPTPDATRPTPPLRSVGSPGAGAEATTVRIATKKLDRILDLVGELVISKSMITSALRKGSGLDPDVRDALGTLERHTRELQDSVMAVRMVPISSVFGRFPRLVHELGAKLGKDVHLELEGTETEIDRAMVEQLADPLTHLVRNAVDHGLETAETRTRAGKPAAGRLVLSASHRGGSVLIEIKDDGRGLDLDRVREKALDRGLLVSGEQVTAEQLHMLVFEPGFSTANAVTDVSGRGVGMDVVKRNVEALGGAIHFTSEAGQGSVVRLQLPLTMAIIDGLMLRVGRASFVVPLLSVVESLRPSPAILRTVLGKARVMTFRGKAIPLVALAEVLHVTDGTTDPTQGIVVVVESGGDVVGLVVDELLADGQVVVKSLEAHYRRLEGLAGATVMGDGNVALILDVPGLARLAAQATARMSEGRAA